MLKISFMGERNHILYTSKASKKDLIITENERIIWQLNYFCIKSLSNNKIKVETHTFCSSYPLFPGVNARLPIVPLHLKVSGFGLLERTIPEVVGPLGVLGGKSC